MKEKTNIMKRFLLSLTILIALISDIRAQLAIEIVTPEEAVQYLVGPDLVVSNISYTGDSLQLGYYYNATGDFPIVSGIMLSTNGVQDLVLNNPPAFLTTAVSGEPDLLDVANSVPPLIGQNFTVSSANDVAILEFDFQATGPDLAFNYVFGSDEYLEWVNSTYNDVFAFFISGPGITGPFASPAAFPDGAMMISGVPGTNPFLPITVSSVNDALNGGYYIDNVGNNDISLDGFTVSLQATATLECGETYHMKLAIADGTDGALESIVAFQEGSFDIQGSSIVASLDDPELAPLGPSTLVEGCVNGYIAIYPPACAAAILDITLALSGTAVNGSDYESIATNQTIQGEELIIPIIPIADAFNDEGYETIEIEMYYINLEGELDTAYTSINIFDYVQPTVEIGDVFICDETVLVTPEVSNGLGPYTYAWSDGATAGSNNYAIGDAGEFSLTMSDYCQTNFSTNFHVIEPEPLDVVDILSNCFGLPTGDLAKGGAAPYEVIYSEDSLTRDEYSFTAQHVGVYTITFTDQCGSTGTSTIYTEVCDTRIPNIFTPNGDGLNDTFEIYGVQGYKGSKLQVFDRWGKVVLEDEDYKNDWDGKGLADGVYYFIFTRADGKINSGHIQKLASK